MVQGLNLKSLDIDCPFKFVFSYGFPLKRHFQHGEGLSPKYFWQTFSIWHPQVNHDKSNRFDFSGILGRLEQMPEYQV